MLAQLDYQKIWAVRTPDGFNNYNQKALMAKPVNDVWVPFTDVTLLFKPMRNALDKPALPPVATSCSSSPPARSPSRLFSSSRDASPVPPAARHGKQVARPAGTPRPSSGAAASSQADHKRPRAKEPQGGAPSKRFSSAGQGGSMDEAEMRAKTERWREECIQEAKALWERLNAGGQGGKEMRAPRMAEFFGGSCRRAAASATRPAAPYFTASRPVHRTLSAATYSPWGFKGLAVDRLPRGTGKDKAAEDCPDGLLWQTEFMDIKPAELPTLDWMHFS